ncbi:ExbD/TolR family protein [Brevundimonas sp. S30B]|uniref:ExbD/TolR family protein n=1 Tax=unclassified Brevundimonas TaxID=2622653 RepID=UPI0010726370|nr:MULTISPECIES: ExbD/TolR family protein [unclassified Brevundimonas]QBX36863.1 ExbD/TolR family protein [Brevundimonas sp. MF30-B]TFW04342.1 ExbD/TolR family protein [Brevundimonas sp. S30B]
MALGGGGAAGGSGRGRGRRRRAPLSEINVTPLVDVMLVLLIIFMISAPLLTVGVPVELPQTEASAVEQTQEPLSVSIDQNGAIYVDDAEAAWDQFVPRLRAQGGDGEGAATDRPVFIRADGRAPYQAVARVMARLSASGFTKLNLITDTAPDAASGG